tara:strand:- start:2215 stop:2376 length:162 start_codon:yes stop_codon:yes gene_type:complete
MVDHFYPTDIGQIMLNEEFYISFSFLYFHKCIGKTIPEKVHAVFLSHDNKRKQ